MARFLPIRRISRQPQGTMPRLKREFADAVVVYLPSVALMQSSRGAMSVGSGATPGYAILNGAVVATFQNGDSIQIPGTSAIDFSSSGFTCLAVGSYTVGGVQPIELLCSRGGSSTTGGFTMCLYNTFGGVPANCWSSYNKVSVGDTNYDSFYCNGVKATSGNGNPATVAGNRYAICGTCASGPPASGSGINLTINRVNGGSSDSSVQAEMVVIWPRKFSPQVQQLITANPYFIFDQRTLPAGLAVATAAAITQQPTSQSVNAGDQATFTVVAPGALTYQWQDNRSGVFADVTDGSGATTDTYTTTASTQAMQARQYRVIVDGTNTSQTATLTVLGFPVYLYATDVQSGNDVWLRDPSKSSGSFLQVAPAGYSVTVPDWATIVARTTSFDAASYGVTTPDVSLTVQHALAVSPASYAVTVPDESTVTARNLPVSPASYAVTEPDAQLGVGRLLPVSPSSYAVTEPDALLGNGHMLAVSPASYAVAVPDEATITARKVSFDPASYAVSAPSALLGNGHMLAVSPAGYAVSVPDEATLVARLLTVSPVAYAVIEPNAALLVNHALGISPASYLVSTPDTATITARKVSFDPASYAVTEPDVMLTKGTVYNLAVAPATYAVGAPDWATVRASRVSFDPAAYSVSEPAVQLGYGRTLQVAPMPVLVAVGDTALGVGRTLSVDPAAYALMAPDWQVGRGYTLGVVPAEYLVDSPDADRLLSLTIPFDATNYVINAPNVNLIHSLGLVGSYSERIMTLQAEDRYMAVEPEDRYMAPQPEDRYIPPV